MTAERKTLGEVEEVAAHGVEAGPAGGPGARVVRVAVARHPRTPALPGGEPLGPAPDSVAGTAARDWADLPRCTASRTRSTSAPCTRIGSRRRSPPGR
ncbi:hypothetical protein [Lentzea sp. NPDC060358]|uniref:hypothetical protein n=1 Tax=Lentzea sp. NPDC060358 TaxID=3347103 RepID=UPI003646A50A